MGDYRRFMRGRAASRQAAHHEQVRQATGTGKTPIMFAVPSESGRVNWSIAMAVGRMMYNSQAAGCPFQFDTHIIAGIRPIQYARNIIVEKFLESPCQWLIMVDDDQVVPENFWQMVTVGNADVVSGKTHCWVGNGYLPGRLRVNQYGLIKREEIEYPECYNISPTAEVEKGPYVVPIVGTGCIAIRRHVIEALGPNCFQFSYRRNGSIMGGEDINFSQACNQSGFVIAVHPGVKFGHMKTVDLGQVDEYAQARVEFERAGKPHSPVDMLSVGV